MFASAFILSFCAASLDIAIDAIRIELCATHHSGFAAATESIGFRLGMLVGGAGALYLAALYDSWALSYWVMAVIQLLAIPVLIFLPKTNHDKTDNNQNQLITAQKPALTIFQHVKKSYESLQNTTPIASLILFILIFKAPDTILNAMSAPFLHNIGFNKIEYANITKSFGIPMMVVGSLIAGYVIHHFSVRFLVIMVIFMQMAASLLFILQYHVAHDSLTLMYTIGVESFVSGMTATAFISMISVYCKGPFSAGHFTFLTAVGSLSRLLFSASAGFIADVFGWITLFMITACTGIPALYCFFKFHSHQADSRYNSI
jgi:PAT family beta-lactamase induction signal transducer AmpG